MGMSLESWRCPFGANGNRGRIRGIALQTTWIRVYLVGLRVRNTFPRSTGHSYHHYVHQKAKGKRSVKACATALAPLHSDAVFTGRPSAWTVPPATYPAPRRMHSRAPPLCFVKGHVDRTRMVADSDPFRLTTLWNALRTSLFAGLPCTGPCIFSHPRRH